MTESVAAVNTHSHSGTACGKRDCTETATDTSSSVFNSELTQADKGRGYDPNFQGETYCLKSSADYDRCWNALVKEYDENCETKGDIVQITRDDVIDARDNSENSLADRTLFNDMLKDWRFEKAACLRDEYDKGKLERLEFINQPTVSLPWLSQSGEALDANDLSVLDRATNSAFKPNLVPAAPEPEPEPAANPTVTTETVPEQETEEVGSFSLLGYTLSLSKDSEE